MYKMLIVNDELSESQNMLYTLKNELDNFLSDLQTASSESETLEKTVKFMPDFIVMDVDLGKESWKETIKTIKMSNSYSQVILITAYDCFDDAVSLSVDDYLLRPVRLTTITDSLYKLAKNISESRKKNDYAMKIREDYEKATNVLDQIRKKYLRLIESDDEEKSSDNDVVQITDKYIVCNYNKNIKLEELASEINISRYHLCRIYREKTGVNFTNTLADIRILKSKELIVQSDMAIKDVAMSVGYTDVSYFSRLFKKVTGISPNDYRKAAYSMSKR